MKKILCILLCVLVILGIVALFVYTYMAEGKIEPSNAVKGVLVAAGAIILIIRIATGNVKQKRIPLSYFESEYEDAETVKAAFAWDGKLHTEFLKAVSKYALENKTSEALSDFISLKDSCQTLADRVGIYTFAGACYMDMRMYNEARNHYMKLIEFGRQNSQICSNLGLCSTKLGLYDEALKYYFDALYYDSDNAYALTNVSSAYFRKGEYQAAEEYCDKALMIMPDKKETLSLKAMLSAAFGREDDATAYLEKAVKAGYDRKKLLEVVKSVFGVAIS